MTKHEYLDAMLNDLTSVANNYDCKVEIGPDTRRPDDKRGPAKAVTILNDEGDQLGHALVEVCDEKIDNIYILRVCTINGDGSISTEVSHFSTSNGLFGEFFV